MRIGAFKRLLSGLAEIETRVSAERGDFSLFALVLEEDRSGLWHLFVAAPWIWEDERAAWKYLLEQANPLECNFGYFSERLQIDVIRPNNPYLEEVWEYCSTENGMVEIYDVEILDVTARRGYIFASRRPAEITQPQPQPQQQERAATA